MKAQVQNTFKNGQAPQRQRPEVMITDKELAAYNYTRLKIAYQRDQTEAIVREIKSGKVRRLTKINNVATHSAIGLVAAAIIGLIIKNIF